jgi:hypothetical protein
MNIGVTNRGPKGRRSTVDRDAGGIEVILLLCGSKVRSFVVMTLRW